MFEAHEVRALINGATVKTGKGKGREVFVAPTPSMKAMVLLGGNCGSGNADCGTLPFSAADLDGGRISYHRPETGVARRCPLWQETIEPLRAGLGTRKKPKNPDDAGLFFITYQGESRRKDKDRNPVSGEMRKLLDALKLDTQRPDGKRNFYALRQTFETIGGESRDQVAVDHIMGHAGDDLASAYRERISDERLKVVSDHVRKWVFGEDEMAKGKKPRKGREPPRA
jgi:integrase